MENFRGVLITVAFIFGFLIGPCASSCDFHKFSEFTVNKFNIQDGFFSSPFESVSDLNKQCQLLLNAFSCAEGLPGKMSPDAKEIFDKLAGGKKTLSKEMCDSAKETHQTYVKHFDCINKVINGASECREKFQKSLKMIAESAEDERNKLFHGCCAFEWKKNCIIGIASNLCGKDVSFLVDKMVVTEVREVQGKLCDNTVGSCFDMLYGFDAVGRLQSSLASWVFPLFLIWVNRFYRN